MAIKWFENNGMVVNPDKFQSMIISAKKNLSCKPVSKLNDTEIKP